MTENNLQFQTELNQLFEKYQDAFELPYLNEIVARKPLFSETPMTAEVLITSINPSYRKRQDHLSAASYDFYSKAALKDAYFKKYHNLFKAYIEHYNFAYLDLFYQRHTEQKDLKLFLSEDQGVQFLKDQITLSRKRIQQLSPKLIFVFNRYAANFWDLKPEKGIYTQAPWLGFTYETISELDGLYRITGSLLSNKIPEPLKGNLVYFSTFLSYRTSKKALQKVYDDIPEIMKIIEK